MKVFAPSNIEVLIFTIAILISTVVIGFGISKIKKYPLAISLSWIFIFISTIALERLCNNEAPGFRMLSIILVILLSMKTVVIVEYYKNKNNPITFIQWIAFTLGWFGMRPHLFESLGSKALQGSKALIYFGISRMMIGATFLFTAAWITNHYSSLYSKIIFTGLALSGISLILHFGILNISAGFWRLSGVDTRTLFKSPLLSTSLTEFWGKRWNLAFSEMTAMALYRPLKTTLGNTFATLIAFLFSGVLHELAISVPVKAGLGLPLLYFLIQGLIMLLEKALEKKGIVIGKNKWLGRAWVIFWLLLPLPILFHSYFLKGIVWPIFKL